MQSEWKEKKIKISFLHKLYYELCEMTYKGIHP